MSNQCPALFYFFFAFSAFIFNNLHLQKRQHPSIHSLISSLISMLYSDCLQLGGGSNPLCSIEKGTRNGCLFYGAIPGLLSLPVAVRMPWIPCRIAGASRQGARDYFFDLAGTSFFFNCSSCFICAARSSGEGATMMRCMYSGGPLKFSCPDMRTQHSAA